MSGLFKVQTRTMLYTWLITLIQTLKKIKQSEYRVVVAMI